MDTSIAHTATSSPLGPIGRTPARARAPRPHRCICGAEIPPDQSYCSDECADAAAY